MRQKIFDILHFVFQRNQPVASDFNIGTSQSRQYGKNIVWVWSIRVPLVSYNDIINIDVDIVSLLLYIVVMRVL